MIPLATLVTPNRSEFREVAGRWKSEDDLTERAQKMRRELGLDALLKRALIPSAKQTAELLASRFSAWAAWATVAMKTRVGLIPLCGWRYLRCA